MANTLETTSLDDMNVFYKQCTIKDGTYITKAKRRNLLYKKQTSESLSWIKLAEFVIGVNFIAHAFIHTLSLLNVASYTVGAGVAYYVLSLFMNFYINGKKELNVHEGAEERKLYFIGPISLIKWLMICHANKKELEEQTFDIKDSTQILKLIQYIEKYAVQKQKEIVDRIKTEIKKINNSVAQLEKINDSQNESDILLQSRISMAQSAIQQLSDRKITLQEQEDKAITAVEAIINKKNDLIKTYQNAYQMDTILASHNLIVEVDDVIEENNLALESLVNLAKEAEASFNAVEEVLNETVLA